MSAEIKASGGPAFPVQAEQYRFDLDRHIPASVAPGMTLRDYFAAKAMQAYVSSYQAGSAGDFQAIAGDSYELADEMLAARSAA